jgi:DNA helicase-2/ATP-dependent DNA helicase PcrA
VGTVVAYLKALARPEEDEVSWNRVLTMRYRLCDSDLRRLNSHDDGLLTALLNTPLEQFEEPDRVAEARDHATTLLSLRESASLSHLYRELKDLTDIEWYLTEQERRDLSQLDDVIDQYGDGAVQPPLSAAFIESLQHYDSLLEESGSTPTSQPELAGDAINVMTVHKSKGLDFPAVLMPRLTADEWAPSSRTYDTLEQGLVKGPEAAFEDDFLARDGMEARRVLHVGMTRAEDVLVLQGGSDDDLANDSEESADDAAEEQPVHDAVEDILPMSVPWRPGSGHIPIWQDLNECLPPSADDWTATLATDTSGDIDGRVTYDGENLTRAAARERVLSMASDSLAGSLETPVVDPTLGIDRLTGPTIPMPAMTHSHTSLETYEECPRQHFLDHVVNAFSDYRDGSTAESTGVSQQAIGVLFHDTAEQAAEEATTDPDDWYRICERLAKQRRDRDALPAAKACIDRYFELDISNWTIVDAEREFKFEVEGHDLVGYIDAVYRTPDDELVIIDYKATERKRDIETNQQLPLYLLACRDLYEEPVSRAGYAYVGEIGPKVSMRTFDDAELDAVRSAVTKSMDHITDTTFARYEAGTHCQWCEHNQLPCADESGMEY